MAGSRGLPRPRRGPPSACPHVRPRRVQRRRHRDRSGLGQWGSRGRRRDGRTGRRGGGAVDAGPGMAADAGAGTPVCVAPPMDDLADAGPATLACEDYYAAQYPRCAGPVRPACEEARARARFVAGCLNEMALPGSGMTPASVEACVQALDASACELPDGPPVACNFIGSLPGDAACNEGVQCQSGACQGTFSENPGGFTGPTTCGTCAPGVPVAMSQADVGAACNDPSVICKPGLYCAFQMRTCTPLGDAGAACGEGFLSPGAPAGCTAPLSCVSLPGMATPTCSSGAAGAFCILDL